MHSGSVFISNRQWYQKSYQGFCEKDGIIVRTKYYWTIRGAEKAGAALRILYRYPQD